MLTICLSDYLLKSQLCHTTSVSEGKNLLVTRPPGLHHQQELPVQWPGRNRHYASHLEALRQQQNPKTSITSYTPCRYPVNYGRLLSGAATARYMIIVILNWLVGLPVNADLVERLKPLELEIKLRTPILRVSSSRWSRGTCNNVCNKISFKPATRSGSRWDTIIHINTKWMTQQFRYSLVPIPLLVVTFHSIFQNELSGKHTFFSMRNEDTSFSMLIRRAVKKSYLSKRTIWQRSEQESAVPPTDERRGGTEIWGDTFISQI